MLQLIGRAFDSRRLEYRVLPLHRIPFARAWAIASRSWREGLRYLQLLVDVLLGRGVQERR